MMSINEWRSKLAKLVSRKAKVGMKLVLNGKSMICVATEEDPRYGTRYVFDSGLAFTQSNICKNIEKCQLEGKGWDIA